MKEVVEDETMEEVGLLVTTAYKGVFFGYGIFSDAAQITLKRARMCIYWPTGEKGVMGLALVGPLPGAKIGPAVPSLILRDVTAVVICTSSAIEKWEKPPLW